jgi:aminoglycoside phosphotransferase (APT) family kinase protein
VSDLKSHDLQKLAQALLPWLHRRIPEAESITLSGIRRSESGGSSETLFLEPLIQEHGRVRREAWVLRIEATVHQIYQDPSVERQYRVMQVLSRSSSVPVPKVLWYESDVSVIGAPFFLMERVEGAIPDALHNSGGFLTQITASQRESIWLSAIQTLASIHTVDIEPFRFLERPSLGDSGLDQEISVWDSYMRWSGAPIRPIQERARQWLFDHLPRERPTGLSWGDARPGNMIFRDNACIAVIDWETVSLAGAETDLGWWLFFDWFVSDGFGVPRLPGLGTREQTLKVWEEFAGRKACNMQWHELFATWRFSLISDRAGHLARQLGLAHAPRTDARSPHAERLLMLLEDADNSLTSRTHKAKAGS